MIDLPSGGGVLPSQWLRKALESGIVRSDTYTIDDSQLQPASIDLRLDDWAYRLRCSFLPGKERVEDALPKFSMGRVDLRDGAVLERNRPYLIPLSESLHLPPALLGRTNPKSSTGRLDIFTRVITDYSFRFDDVAAGYRGRLFLEVVSRSFTIIVRRGTSLNQLRLISKGQGHGLSDAAVQRAHSSTPLLFLDAQPVPRRELPLNDGLFLSLALPDDGSRSPVGWRAKKNSYAIDLAETRRHDPGDFWEPVLPEKGGGIVLEPEEFYLLLSRESVRVPPELAAEMVAYDPTSGELRTHYAGFFDPGFGHAPEQAMTGSRAALEVRAHDVPFMVQDEQQICKLSFEKLVEPPDLLYGSVNSHYQFQLQTLSKHFRLPEEPAASTTGARAPNESAAQPPAQPQPPAPGLLPLFEVTPP